MKKILTKIVDTKSVFIFDFDGVIINSMIVKGRTFADIFNTDQELKIINYHLVNGSQNRVEKIKYILSKILNYKNDIKDEVIVSKVNIFKKI